MNNENLPAKIDEETGEVLEPVVEDEDTIKTHLPFQPLSENEVIKHMINSPFLKEFVYTVQGKQDISAVGAREIANMFGYQTTETQYAESADGAILDWDSPCYGFPTQALKGQASGKNPKRTINTH